MSVSDEGAADEFSRLCHALGMHPLAAAGWKRICTNPLAAMFTYLTSMLMAVVTCAALFIAGFPWPTWPTFIPLLVLVLGGLSYWSGMFYMGPNFASQGISAIILLSFLPPLVFLLIACFVGPDEYVPFNNKAITTPFLFIVSFLMNMSGECGGLASTIPEAPHVSLLTPALEAFVTSLRAMNSITDWALVRVMLRQARPSLCTPEATMRYTIHRIKPTQDVHCRLGARASGLG